MSRRRKGPARTPPVDAFAKLIALPAEVRGVVVRDLSGPQKRTLHDQWDYWTLTGQRAPIGDWRVWLIRAGRGFGKTRAGAEWVSELARRDPGARIALVGATAEDVHAVMVGGVSGLLNVARVDERPVWRRDRGELIFSSGARAFLYSAGAPEKLRGPEHSAAWCDELGKWREGGAGKAWDNLMLGLRLGEDPRVLVTTTPRSVPLMLRVMAMPGTVETRGGTRDNPWLPARYLGAMVAEYDGTRLGRQELDGEMLEDAEGALWTREMIEACRVVAVPERVRVVVGVDPPASAGGDACGIVAVALGRDGLGYVIEDASVSGASPERWARAVAACAARHGAERVVAEKNQGGEMVASVLLAADAGLPVKLVHASRGKSARAEPVSLLYEAGRVRHAGAFPSLEDELCGMMIAGGYEGPGGSPDRADALVWALSELMLGKRARARILRL